MTELGKTIFLFGIVLVVLGLILLASPKVPFLGKLPGDILIKRDGFTFYFPLATSIVLSLLLILVINLFFRK